MAKLPKPTVKEIRDYRQELVGTHGAGGFYSTLRAEQTTDQQFYDDEFKVNITDPYRIKRTGTAARICDSISWHIDTANPQASREPRKSGEPEDKRAKKVTTLLNHWLLLMVEEIEEAVKNAVRRGEAFFQMEYNPNYNSTDSNSLPIMPMAPDPMIVYPDPHEYRGVPRQVIKSCRMTCSQVEQLHPNWSNPQKRKLNSIEGVDYFAWWNKDWRYFEADEESLLPGDIQPNVLGAVPFVHCPSGFGKKSPEGKPEAKYRGLLSPLRGRLIEECEIESRIDSQIGLFTNPVVKAMKTDPNADPEPTAEQLDFGPGRTIIVPFGWQIDIIQGQVPSAQMFQHLYQIKQALGVELPPIALGLPSTSRATGRQEDIYGEHYRQRFSKLIGNVERALATALGMGLKYLDTIPGALPITVRATAIENGKSIRKEETITKEDIDGYYDCTVRLQVQDSSRDFMKYRLLASENRVSWETLLVEGLGWTKDRAQSEITDTLVEMVWRTNPQMLDIVLREAMEEAGRGNLLKKVDEQAAQQAASQQLLAGMPPAKTRPPEATNPLAADTLRQVLQEGQGGVRQSGAGYMQGV